MQDEQMLNSHDAQILFDAAWYTTRYPDSLESGMRPEDHYQRIGDAKDYWPNPLFDPVFYAGQYPDVPVSGGSRLIHYYEEGENAGAKPNICFDPSFYRDNYPDLNEVTNTLLLHYLRHGGKEGRNPSLLFDGSWYHTLLVDLVAATAEDEDASSSAWLGDSNLGSSPNERVNPVAHYLHFGEAMGLQPHPLFDPGYYASQQATEDSAQAGSLARYLDNGDANDVDPHPLFQAQFYLSQFESGRVPETNFLVHYLEQGEEEGKLPNPLFDPHEYLRINPDLEVLKIPLLHHYAKSGSRELRASSLLFDARWYADQYPETAKQPGGPLAYYLAEGDRLGHNPHPLFDAAHYASQHPEVAHENGMRIRHFISVGGRDGTSPHPLFDSAFYLGQGPALDSSEENLLFHYIQEGEAAGLLPNPVFDPDYYEKHGGNLRNLPYSKLEHFRRWGQENNRNPSPFFHLPWIRSKLNEAGLHLDDVLGTYLLDPENFPTDVHPLFDQTWYRRECPPDKLENRDPIRHFLDGAWRYGISPTPFFEMDWYRDTYAEALDPDENPLLHYLQKGERSGLQPNAFFDPGYYRKAYSLHPESGQTLLELFVREGISRGHRPSESFDFSIAFFRDKDESQRDSKSNPARGFFYGQFAERISADAEIPIRLPDTDEPEATIIIPAYGEPLYTLACLRSISRAMNETPFEVLLVDDSSEGDALAPVKEIANLRTLTNETNLGFLHSCNRGAAHARGKYLVFLNNDTLVTDGWLDELVKKREAFPNAGITGSRLLFPTGKLQESGSVVFSDGSAINYGWGKDATDPAYAFARRTDYVSGASMAISADLFEELGGFDAHFEPAYYEDTDLAFRVREAGKDVVVQPASTVIHFGGASHGRNLASALKSHQTRNQERFFARWQDHLLEGCHPSESPENAAFRLDGPRALVIDATMLTPDRDSGSLRMFNLLQVLRTLGYAVTFIPKDLLPKPGYLEKLQQSGVHVLHAPYLATVSDYLEQSGSQFELCILSRPDTAMLWMEKARLLCPNARILYDTVDLHFLRRERELVTTGRMTETNYEKKDELRAVLQAEATLVVSDAERQRLLEEVPSAEIHVVSNIHKTSSPRTSFEERSDLLFVGGFGHPPNEDAIRWFVGDILPSVTKEIPEIRLHVVGSRPSSDLLELASSQVLFWGFVPNLDEHLAMRRVSVAPLRYGAGIKGKVNEAMAHGLPCVATSIAAEGIDAAPGEEILVADEPTDFAREIVEVYRSRTHWNRVSKNSISSVERQCSFEVAKASLNEATKRRGVQNH